MHLCGRALRDFIYTYVVARNRLRLIQQMRSIDAYTAPIDPYIVEKEFDFKKL